MFTWWNACCEPFKMFCPLRYLTVRTLANIVITSWIKGSWLPYFVDLLHVYSLLWFGCFFLLVSLVAYALWLSLVLETFYTINEQAHDETYNKSCAPSEDSDQPAHPRSLIRVFADRMYLLQPPAIQRGINENPSRAGGCTYWSESLLVTKVLL